MAAALADKVGSDRDRFLRYALVGAFTTLLGLALQVVGHGLFGWPYLVAFIAAYVVTVSIAYFMHGRLVFHSETLGVGGFFRFHLVYVGQFMLAGVLLAAMVELMAVPVLMAQAVTMGAAALFSFFANRRFTFAD